MLLSRRGKIAGYHTTLVTFPDTRIQQWLDYDAFGQPGRFIDERGNTTNLSYQWGPMKKPHTVTTHRDRDGGGTEDQPTNFDYDGMGRPTWTFFPDGSSSELTSYVFGQVDAFKTRKNQTKRVHYDARGREDYHTWDSDAAPRIDRTWDPASRMTSISNIFSTIDYDYDDAGQPKYEGSTITGSGGRVQTTFHRYANGDLANLGYPAGPWVRHDYTARGQLKTAGVADGSGNWAFQLINYYYWEDGKVEHQDYGNGTGTGTGNDYDERGFPRSINIYRFSPYYQSYSHRTYSRDSRDRIWAWQKDSNTGANPKENGRGDRYAYDAEGQLTEAYYECADPAGNFTGWRGGDVEYYGYDALGNRRFDTWNGSRGWTHFNRRDNGLNQYSSWSPSAISYEGNGVLTQEGSINSDYNALNQPIWMWTANLSSPMYFGYDPLGRCVKRWSFGAPTTFLYYDGWNLIQEGTDAWSPTRLYVHGNRVDEIVTTFNVVTSQYGFHHYELRGHCAFVTDISGNIMEQYEYDAWGKPYYYDASGNWLGYSPFGNRFLFTGREWLSDLGVYDYRNRLYHPELGRFLQPDPKEFAAGDYNLYRYCHNDPVNHTDPSGLAPGDPFGSADDAARDVHSFINPTSIKTNTEYGSTIYKLNGSYYATVPLGGTADHSYARNPTPEGAKTVGDYHDHGAYSYKDPKTGEITRAAAPGHGLTGAKHDNQNSDHASPKDKAFYKQQAAGKSEYKGYLGTPSGRLLGIDPHDTNPKEKDLTGH
jgi:RHS repeat-associated protein